MSSNLTDPERGPWSLILVIAVVLLGAVSVGVGCSDPEGDSAGSGADSLPSSTNPDAGEWRDLSREPFDPSRVGGTLVVAYRNGPTQLNNLLWNLPAERNYLKHYLCPFLLEETPDSGEQGITVRPAAAKVLPQVQADGRTYIWTLRDDLTWSDGKPLTARDYTFSWELMKNPEIRCDTRRNALNNVESVKALDDHTLEVRFKEVYYNAAALFGLQFTVVPAHASPTTAAAFNDMKQHVGFGPYRIAQRTKQRLLLSLRDEYKTRPYPIWPWYIEHIEFRFGADAASRLEQLRTGKLDVGVVPVGRFESMKADREFLTHNWTSEYPLPSYDFVAWNGRDPDDVSKPHELLASASVRRALAHVIDRDHIVAKVRRGLAEKVTGPYWFRDIDYDRDVQGFPFDPKKARALLEAEGWKLNSKGVLEKDGRPFRFKMLFFDRPVWREQVLVVQDGARQAGIDIELDGEADWPTVSRRMGTHQYDSFLIRNGLTPPIEPDQYELFHSSFARKTGMNWAGLEDPAVDALLEATRRTLDRDKRLAMRRQFHRLFHELQPFSVICCTYSTVGVSRRWSNVKVHDLGLWFRDFQLRR